MCRQAETSSISLSSFLAYILLQTFDCLCGVLRVRRTALGRHFAVCSILALDLSSHWTTTLFPTSAELYSQEIPDRSGSIALLARKVTMLLAIAQLTALRDVGDVISVCDIIDVGLIPEVDVEA